MLTTRKQQILESLITDYIHLQKGISSQHLSEVFDLSPATIRNEMADLEEAGFVSQPHTSAGRIPTEQGYRFYVQQCLKVKPLGELQKKMLHEVVHQESDIGSMKQIARLFAEWSSDVVFVFFSSQDVYITGLSNLFSHSDTFNFSEIRCLSGMFDELEERLYQSLSALTDGIHILIGSENPLGSTVSTCFLKCRDFSRQNDQNLIGMLGPLRMNYQQNYSLLHHLDALIEEKYTLGASV